LQELEQDLLAEETQLPVYFTHETPELMSVYDDISKSVSANSAGSAAEGDRLVCVFHHSCSSCSGSLLCPRYPTYDYKDL